MEIQKKGRNFAVPAHQKVINIHWITPITKNISISSKLFVHIIYSSH